MNTSSTAVAPAIPAAKQVPHGARSEGYGQILRSTALIGGSSTINVAIGIFRTKAMAILLGPSGFGLFGLFSSIGDVVQNLAGMGIQNSGVRQIAEAVGTGDAIRIARTVTVLRRVAILLGTLGGAVLVALSYPIHELTFADTTHVAGVALMGSSCFSAKCRRDKVRSSRGCGESATSLALACSARCSVCYVRSARLLACATPEWFRH